MLSIRLVCGRCGQVGYFPPTIANPPIEDIPCMKCQNIIGSVVEFTDDDERIPKEEKKTGLE